MVHMHLVDELLAEEEGLVLAQVHIVLVAQGTVHDGERMKHEIGEPHIFGVDPSDRACGLQTESGAIGKAHGEIVSIAQIAQ